MHRRGWVEGAAVAAVAVLLSVLLTYPLAFRLDRVGRVDSGDGRFSIWNVAWVARTLVVSPLTVFDANIFYPHKNTLAYSESNIGTGALAIPGYWATRNPYVAHNSVVLFAFFASLVGMYLLARHITGSPAAALVSGIAFAYCPYIFARMAHIQLLMTAGLPLCLLAMHRLVDRPTPGRALVLSFALAAQALCCAYYGIFGGLAVGLGVLYYAATRGSWKNRRYWLCVAGAAAVSILLVLPCFIPYLHVQESGFLRSIADSRTYSADWRAYLASSAWGHRWMLPLLGRWKEVLFPGFVATILGLAGIWLGLRRVASGHSVEPMVAVGPTSVPSPNGVHRDRICPATGFYALLGGLSLWASFGPDAGLYYGLYRAIPLFSLLRAPARMAVMVALTLSVLAAIALTLLLARRSRTVQWAVCGPLAILTILEGATIPLYLPEAGRLPPAYRKLAEIPPGTPLIELPYFSERTKFHLHTLYMLNSTSNWNPIVNGYSDFFPSGFRSLAPSLAQFPTDDSFAILKRRGVKYAMFHMNLYPRDQRADLIDRITYFRNYLKPLVTAENVWLYEIVSWPH